MENVKILYLDDNQKNIDKFKDTFQSSYSIFTSSSPQESTHLLEKEPIAVIVANQDMKSMSGIKFFESILSEHPDPIRIVISEGNDAEALINAINQGQVFRYISSDSDPNELKQSVDVGVKIYLLQKKKLNQIKKMREETLKGEKILSLFSRYVPKHVVDQTLSKDSQNLFGGEQRNITVLFAAIKDLTKLTELTEPNKTLQYLNDYFSLMTQSIEEHKGMVDKLIGDNLLAIFGAPVPYLHNEKNAVFCALSILEKLKSFNEKQMPVMGFSTQISIGIHSGDAIIGNIGSHQYISYTAVGDTVNTASRILEIAKKNPNTILASESVQKIVKNDFSMQSLGKQTIRGKEQPLELFQVTGKILLNEQDK